MWREVGIVALGVLVAFPLIARATGKVDTTQGVGALVNKALVALAEDAAVRTALRGRSLQQQQPYFPRTEDPRFVVVPIELEPRADETDVVGIGIAGFTELQYRIDRLHLRIVQGPSTNAARITIELMTSTLDLALPIARARFAQLPASRPSNVRYEIHATLMCYSGRNDTWRFVFAPVGGASESRAVTIEIDPHTRKVLSVR